MKLKNTILILLVVSFWGTAHPLYSGNLDNSSCTLSTASVEQNIVCMYKSLKITNEDIVKSDGGLQLNTMLFLGYTNYVYRNQDQFSVATYIKVAKRHLPKKILERSEYFN